MRRTHVEEAKEYAGRYRVRGGPAVAWYVVGWETAPTEDTEWDGIDERTGNLLAVMVGDDRRYVVDPDDLLPLKRSEYCSECGQVGCAHGAGDPEDD